MLKDQDKYQNLVSQIHDLNRQNLLNENEKIEQLTDKIDKLEKKLNKIDDLKVEINSLHKEDNKEEKENKTPYYILTILILNSIILLYLIYSTSLNNQNTKILEKNPNKSEIKKEEIKQEDNVLSLNKEVLVNNEENYEEIKPLIRKGTIYTCKDDTNIYEIPYTIEIKGKLYANRFLFILQKDSTTKDCIIKKEHM